MPPQPIILKREILMKMMKFITMAILAVMLTVGSAVAGPYVGIQGGASFNSTSNTNFDGIGVRNPKIDTSGVIGAFGGYDFNDNQFPFQARYFGIEGQYLFNGYNLSNTSINGNQNSIAILGVVKYPLVINNDYPRGRVFPYVGVGPGIVFTTVYNKPGYGFGDRDHRSNSTNMALVIEPGVRVMVTPKVSAKVAYQLRYCQPNLNGLQFNSWNNMMVFGAAYHF
jgi:opacity protein-like surface antigen